MPSILSERIKFCTKQSVFSQLVCIIVEEEKDVAAFKSFVDDSPPTKAAPAPAAPVSSPSPQPSQPKPPPAPTSSAPSFAKSSERLFASPLAKRLAAEQGLDLKVNITILKLMLTVFCSLMVTVDLCVVCRRWFGIIWLD